jgi:death on curing protein
MKEPHWIDRRALALLQAESLAEHGGHAGVIDEGLLDSALARPRQIFTYEASSDLARLAAAYATGIIRDHPFADGNERAAFLAAGLFLELHGFRLAASPVEATRAVLAVGAGEMKEEEFAAWIRGHTKRRA